MPSNGQTWVLASIGAVVEMGVLRGATFFGRFGNWRNGKTPPDTEAPTSHQHIVLVDKSRLATTEKPGSLKIAILGFD
jgi:hypothetical protein